MRASLTNWRRALVDATRQLLPAQCVACHCYLRSHENLCADCILALPRIRHFCARCGDPFEDLNGVKQRTECRICPTLTGELYFRHSISLYHYAGTVRTLLTEFKFHRALAQGRCLAERLAEEYQHFYIGREFPEIILPVPLHCARLRERGYNQAQELAAAVGSLCRRPVSPSYLSKIRGTERQSKLGARERRKNLRGAFALTSFGQQALKQQQHRTVALIDDVVTSHTTSNTICKLLRQQGAEWIDVWSIARA